MHGAVIVVEDRPWHRFNGALERLAGASPYLDCGDDPLTVGARELARSSPQRWRQRQREQN
jgi:hypothetical protein